MPTYEYQCQACDYTFEEFQSMSEPPLQKCPKCGKNSLRRLIGTGMGIIFKGSGFYETDYKRKSAPSGDKEKGSSDGSKDASQQGTTGKENP